MATLEKNDTEQAGLPQHYARPFDQPQDDMIIAELSDSVIARARAILARVQPLEYVQHVQIQGMKSVPFPARRFEFDHDFRHYELSQYLPYQSGLEKVWERTAVSTFHEGSRVMLLSGSAKNPILGKIFIKGGKAYAPIDDIHDVLVRMESALGGWLQERDGGDSVSARIFSVFDRADGVVQGISNRVFPPKD